MKKTRIMETSPTKKELNKGAWTEEEDRKLGEVISVNGPRRWKTIAAKAGLNRCGKSCRLRWLNYLRPNIKRGNISHQEQDLIIRLHKLLGNRWSLIAGRLPGRTDNEVKNYWNSHLSKRMKNKQKSGLGVKPGQLEANDKSNNAAQEEKKEQLKTTQITTVSSSKEQATTSSISSFNTDDDFFDFSNENPMNLEWVTRFLKKKLD